MWKYKEEITAAAFASLAVIVGVFVLNIALSKEEKRAEREHNVYCSDNINCKQVIHE